MASPLPYPTGRTSLLTLLVLVSGAAACSDGSPTGPEPIQNLPRTLTQNESVAIQASNDFAFGLLREVRADLDPGENVFISPLSVSMALGMAANGAAGETLDAMKLALGVQDLTRDEMNEAYRGLLDVLPPLDPEVEVGIANSMWARQGFPMEDAFLQRVETFFDGEAQELDFSDPGSKDVINGWVDEMTRGRIDEIVQEIRPSDLLFLINAVYFKGSWTTQFDPDETASRPFYLEDGSDVDVPMMSEEDMPAGYYFGDDVVVADLPYGGEAYSMTLVVPWQADLTTLLGQLTRARWDAWMEGLHPDTIPVQLPRFQMEFEAGLEDPLTRMGMGVAFTGAADFSDMTPLGVFIDRVRHKTFLKVDEEGTEAAAVTSVVMTDSLGPMFLGNKPFLVAIRERLSGTILFLGAVYDPS